MTPTCHHICIQTNDYTASKAFYMDMLGFELEKETANFHGRDFNTWLRLGTFRIELQTPKAGEHFEPFNKESCGIPHFCLLVDSVEREYQVLIDKGFDNFILKQGNALYQVYDSLLIKLQAPEGTIIELRDLESLGE